MLGGRTRAARSSAVRATEVTGIRCSSLRSSSPKVRERWISRPSRLRRGIGVVTWTGTGLVAGINPSSQAADQWLSSAPLPHPSTAARHLPCSEMSVCPTA